ncbi:MAG: hypothetical protein JXM74_06330 [Fusobacteriaceae bacterium]|nr:hypothetical protein [Fusobacteriaceae bacterium]MBN2838356.1 hypothetical protein [Fusobacteriaceae bacterium]
MVKNETIVDVSINLSSRRPRKINDLVKEDRGEEKTQETVSETKIAVIYSDDKEARWIKKYGTYLYEYKIHNSINERRLYFIWSSAWS